MDREYVYKFQRVQLSDRLQFRLGTRIAARGNR